MLFTGKGDGGTTKAFDTASGQRISKSSALPEALGTLDELNSFLGLAKVKAAVQDPVVPLGRRKLRLSGILADIQETLFTVQAEVAGAPKKVGKVKVNQAALVINTIETLIPPITNFTVAGGTELSATLDVARTIARRAERRVIGLTEQGVRKVSPNTKAYLNRLSSLLFALARYANESSGIARETPSYK